MPRYELDIHEADGSVTHGEHESDAGVWYDSGHQFEYEGRTLQVRMPEEVVGGGFDQRLICVPLD